MLPQDLHAAPPRVSAPGQSAAPPVLPAPKGTPSFAPGAIVVHPTSFAAPAQSPVVHAAPPAPVDYSYLRQAAAHGAPASQIGNANLKAMGLPHAPVGPYSMAEMNAYKTLPMPQIKTGTLLGGAPSKFLDTAAIANPGVPSAVLRAPKLAGNLLKDFVSIPVGMVQSTAQSALGMAHDIKH